MIRNWTIFEGKPNAADRGKPRVTINHKRVILLNKAAYEAIGRPPAVELCFDRKYSVIGLRPLRDPKSIKNAFPLNPKRPGSYWTITAASFCRHFDIRIEGTQLFTEPTLDRNGVLELDLAKTQLAGRGCR
jgi:hypothetical protein